MNVTSVSTLGKYLATGMPVVERTITVDGDACAKPQNIVVPVGTAYQDIIDFAGVKGELGKVVAGGAMMGPAVENLSYPTTKTTSGLIMLSAAAAEPPQVNPCIRCGRCVEYCPMGLEPVEVNQAYAARDVQELGKLHADYCFNCGSCTFVCPAKRPCTQMMGLAKAFYLGEIKKGGNK
jgi:electron transport complex protein RnfC